MTPPADEVAAGISDRRPVRRVALASLVAALALVALKLATALATGSLAMLSETAHSGLDAMVTALTLYAVAVAARPPDADHPYGHGKAENVAAMAEAVALLLLAATLGREAVLRLLHPGSPIDTAWYAFAVMAASMALDAFRFRVLAATGRKYHSPALMADAVNFKADLLTSAAVLLGLAAVRLGYQQADAIGGFVVATYVAVQAFLIGKRSIDALMDRAPEVAVRRIRQAAGAIPGVQVRRVRLRYAGGQPQTDVVVGVSRTVPLELAHSLTEEVEEAIRSVEPGADVVVHVEPLADEKVVAEQVLSVAARHPAVHQVHNVFVARRPDGLHISLHAKFPGSMTLAEAHAIAEHLEADIAAEVNNVARVDTHLEPLERAATPGADVTSQRSELVHSVTSLAESHNEVRNCHEVVVTGTAEGLSVVMHCEAEPGLSVVRVHDASTMIEDEIHRRWPEVERVTVHFEPAKLLP
ncbi:MAG TPA: cation-efflux pump [Actinomycetota bacterium]|nr:cation-efflux pump [Actinomycetota bacterium]